MISGESVPSVLEGSDMMPKGSFEGLTGSPATPSSAGDAILSNATAAALGSDHASDYHHHAGGGGGHYMSPAPPYYPPHYPSNNNVYSGMYGHDGAYSLSLPAPAVEFTYVPAERDGSGGYLAYSGSAAAAAYEASPPREGDRSRQDGFGMEHHQTQHWQTLECSPQFIGFASPSDAETALVSECNRQKE